jgi:hypothetical protein
MNGRPLHEVLEHPLFQTAEHVFPTPLDAALTYAKRGWRVFPVHTIRNGVCSCGKKLSCSPGKHPHEQLVPHGLLDATCDPGRIRAWWTKDPAANIGVRMGVHSGVVGIDIDPRHSGDKTLIELQAKNGVLPVTLTSLTGGGGTHLFFRCRRVEYRSRANALGEGVDVKGEGGYLVLPPSNHVSGGSYRWANYGVPIADLPRPWERLMPLAGKRPTSSPANGNAGKVGEGGRENLLTSLAGTMRRRGMSVEAIRAALRAENLARCEPPVSDADSDRIANSVGRYAPAAEAAPGSDAASPGSTSFGSTPPTTESAPLPIITVIEGEHPRATDEAEEILLRNAEEEGIFQRAGEIIRIIKLPEARKSAGLSRPAGTIMLEPMTLPTLMETLERRIQFNRVNVTEAGSKPYRVNCPRRIATAYLSRRGSWRLSTLTGIITAPIMRLDGTMLSQPGYDEETGLYFAGESFPRKINDTPSLEDAQKALQTLCAPFAQFPFCKDEDRTVVIAAILTSLERRLLAACPLIGYSAPTQRSGKTLLAEAAAILSTGKPAPASAVSPDREEFRKALTSALREGQACINLDNIEHPLKSPDLAKIITQPEFSDRVLGESKTLCLPTNIFWTCTGNNLSFRGDLATRALLCRIDANLERPERREFAIPDLKAHLLERRAELVAAGLTVLRAYHVAGRPNQKLPRWGGFDHWSDFIRSPIVWAGLADPCLTRETVIGEDPEKESAYEALIHLKAVFGTAHFTAKDAAEKANDQTMKTYAYPELHEALSTVTGGDKCIDPTRLGKWFRSWRGRFVDGVRLLRANSERTSTATWRVA